MKIQIIKEKFYSHQCPAIPKRVMDVFYSKLKWLFGKRYDVYNIERIDNIKIRVNQSYEGSSSFHFYVTIDNFEEFHTEIWKGDTPMMHVNDRSRDKMHPRFEWITDFERCGVYMGENNCQERIDELWRVKKEKENSPKRVKKLKSDYDKYLKLKKQFGHYDN